MIVRYNSSLKSEWNEFLSSSKNSTFLFHRDFMDYHSDRFSDYSLMFYEGGKLKGLFPANITNDNIIWSHQGLSYGSWIVRRNIKSRHTIKFIYEVLEYLHESGIPYIKYKQFPDYYNAYFSGEINYCMHIVKAMVYRRDLTSIVNLAEEKMFSKRRNRAIKKGKQNNLYVKEDDHYKEFWNNCLIPNLKLKYNVSPVHTIDEIVKLSNNFPDNIKQYNVYYQGRIIGGCTIFETNTVAHVQYIAANELGKSLGALDFLFDYLINIKYGCKKIFDFGISTYDQGRKLNTGLLDWKEEFGARSWAIDFYNIETKNYKLLDRVIYS